MTAHGSSPVSVPSTDGVVLALHDLGGTGTPVLLCHATGFHGRVWAPLAHHLADRAHAWAPDLRGHGDSAVPAELPMDWWRFADDVLAVVDHLGLTGVRAAGHSKGAASLLLAELVRPGTFSSLYLFEPIVFPGPVPTGEGQNPLAASARRRRPDFVSYEAAIANFASKPPLDILRPDVLDAYVRYGFRPTGNGTEVTLKCRPEVEAQVYEMGSQHGAFTRLAEIDLPVVVARGAVEAFGPGAFAAAIAEALPKGTLEEHPELGHFGPLQDPARIADRVAAALDL